MREQGGAMARDELLDLIGRAIVSLNRPAIVGINGAYTSGKTVFSEALQAHLEACGEKTQLVHYDDFHNPLHSITWPDGGEIDAFYLKAFNEAKLMDEILQPIRTQGRLEQDVACLNWATGEHTNFVHFDVDAHTIVLVEGVLLFRPPLIDHFDYKIYLNIGHDEMIRRAGLRDVPQFGASILDKYASRYIPVQQRYEAEHAPERVADITIDNNDWDAPRVAD